ncbi:MAG: hypothetical protein AAF984_08715 [Verrucomicrobiota bacterium]
MTEWWNSLELTLQIFYGIAILSLLVLLVQFAMMMLGVSEDGMDMGSDTDINFDDHSSGLGVLSVRTITAFFTGFGWVGAISLKNGVPMWATIIIAFAAGIILMFAVYFAIMSLLKMQSSGSLKYKNGIGQIGTVYVTIPPHQKGAGQIEILIQGRLITAEAFTKENTTIKPQTKVKVVALIGVSSFLVEVIK